MLKVGKEQNNSSWSRGLRGIIFDSCPATITAEMSAVGVLSALMAKSAEQVEQDHEFLIKVVEQFAAIGLHTPLIQSRLKEVGRIWSQEAPVCKHLYHYSTKDLVIPYKEVEQFMRKQEERGCKVSGCNWHDSQHVEHYRRHPERYRQSLEEFAKQISW
eukprot:TRINITY_DN12124_c0_g1_i1.p2 TRINITY_DN12124_c0_g1~~TRINITY_DN12124_c0_g1_i1.p2  ORF type:complete len:159 (-),score=11.41 TRINITY_DN12124_c0_g1_i1:17-493(-)